MSLNKFTTDSERKEWMLINCKKVTSESSAVDVYAEVKKGSTTAPPVDSVRLYNRSGNNLAIVDSSGNSSIIAVSPLDAIYSPSTYFSQSEVQIVSATAGVYGLSILTKESAGKGSLVIPPNGFENGALYELTVSGVFTILTSPKLINFGLFLDGALHRDGKSTLSLPVATGEAFTVHIYLSARDQGGGNVVLFPSGKITVSGGGNLGVTPLTGPNGTFATPIQVNAIHELDLRTNWTSAQGDSIKTEYATLVRCS